MIIKKLIDKPLSSITKFDTDKVDSQILELKEKIKIVSNNIENIRNYTIDYYEKLLLKYGKGRERKTEISQF